ncbi:unnamed protein product [Didymodactylos carnosus]|uniref:Uncharacterized protein n=1 Tax=Didymodactylos carnosus TaxID=1234261 RepID=A0A815JXX1_9BILA|nr:unnamed protein product [Didymodactylos carnosus]CAF1385161.1 unnamed protein product [Didymodactylos carnosus]CAF4039616.1 unnamed protein product [Didymodactylos carnosus]CAF4280313.1 unnamed protein product [Didymodactylos carnosus]
MDLQHDQKREKSSGNVRFNVFETNSSGLDFIQQIQNLENPRLSTADQSQSSTISQTYILDRTDNLLLQQKRMSSDPELQKLNYKEIIFNEENLTTDTLQHHQFSQTATLVKHRLSTISQIYLPHGNEYHHQRKLPANSPDLSEHFLLNDDTVTDSSIDTDTLKSITDDDSINDYHFSTSSKHRLFIFEPIITGLIIFPILVLFWACGWNLILIMLNKWNSFSLTLHLVEIDNNGYNNYTWTSLIVPYFIAQFILLLTYLLQDSIYNFLKYKCKYWLLHSILLKFHILLLASTYIVQWEMMWTIWDQYSPQKWYFEILMSLTSLFALIVLNGHLCDLVCAPFLVSYDSVEYCIQFGCPLLTRQMSQWIINLINHFLYEYFVSILTIVAWRGFYNFLDKYLYPGNVDLSAGLCFLFGYILYFLLMYFQTYFEDLNIKYEFWAFVSINFPQFYHNIQHLLAFISCLLIWRGYWMIFDTYIYIFKEYHYTYLLLFIVSFLVMALLQTSSSINGPLSNMPDYFSFFPLYPNCYLTIMVMKYSKFFGRFGENTSL